MKRKVPLMILTILILQVLLPVLTIIWESSFTIKSIAATTYEATDSNGISWTYELQDNKAINVKPKDKTTLPSELIIPSTLDGYEVKVIGVGAFSNCASITSIEIPDGVTSIESWAFGYCLSLINIKIPMEVTNIGDYAFYYCSELTKIEIPAKVTSIGNEVFGNCNSLTSIEIPEKVTNIGEEAFNYCSSLTSINVNENNQNYSSENGVLFSKDGTKLIKYPESKKEREYIIPNNVSNIGKRAFYNCQLENIIIPESVILIGEGAFSYCKNLKNIEIPNNIQNIGGNAFYNSKCTIVVEKFDNIETVELPNIIKRAMVEEDILYANEEFTLINCLLSDNKNQLILNEGIVTATLEVTGGALKGLSIEIKPEKYYINTAQDLWDFAAEVNNGNTFEGITVELTANIDLGCSQDNQWITIGGNLGADDSEPCFAGTFNGQGYKISGLLINNDKNCQGLFGSNKGTLKNIICEGSITNTFNSSNGDGPIGGLVAYNDNGTIYNCQTYIYIVADRYWVGGIVGNSAGGTIEKCTNFGDINSTNVENEFAGYAVGGIIGVANNTTVKECSNNGKITGSLKAVGGIIGNADYGVQIEKCNNNGIIKGNYYVGGIAGQNHTWTITTEDNLIYDCYNTSVVEGNHTIGGIVGHNGSKIEKSYNKGTIKGQDYIGGIVGENRYGKYSINGHIEYCYNEGEINGYTSVGGIVGVNGALSWNENLLYKYEGVNVSKCYNNGKITSGILYSDVNSNVPEMYYSSGGIAGFNQGGNISNCYNSGIINGINTKAGGITGVNLGYIESCYNVGKVEGDKTQGGIIEDNYVLLNIYTEDGEQARGSTENTYYLNSCVQDTEKEIAGVVSNEEETMKTNDFVALLNSANKKTIWKMGDSTYPYPVLKSDEEIIVAVLKGDANGDNQVNFRDILTINNHRLGKTQLTGDNLIAADVTGDGNIDFRDILQVNRFRLGKIDSL